MLYQIVKHVISLAKSWKSYDANFSKINIKNSSEIQNQLKELIGGVGKITVPVVIFGEKQIVGYDKFGLVRELEAAGFEEKG